MIVDGRAIASTILADARSKVASLGRAPIVRAITVAPDAATRSYLRIKKARAKDAGMTLEVVELPEGATTTDCIVAIGKEGADGVIVQLPLPESIDTEAVLDAIPWTMDPDVLSSDAKRRFYEWRDYALLPPVVAATEEILRESGVEIRGVEAAVIGKGRLVGEPVAAWLTHEGAHVSVVTKDSGDLKTQLEGARIIVSGAGVPGLITADAIDAGAAVIDAGTSESGGAIVGDAAPEVAETAGVFTPVPGGVGPVAVACLFRNMAILLGAYGLRLPEEVV